ncbi:hypothetical protein ACFL1J_00805 [Pseudomonadota bacterium]
MMSEIFTFHLRWFKSRPTAEILRNGKPFWEELPWAKDHFSFGRRKAILLLSCLDTIRAFHDSDGVQPGPEEEKTTRNMETLKEIKIRYFNGFKLHGNWVDRPHLMVVENQIRIGLGMMKARAILELEGEIIRFVDDTKVLYPMNRPKP